MTGDDRSGVGSNGGRKVRRAGVSTADSSAREDGKLLLGVSGWRSTSPRGGLCFVGAFNLATVHGFDMEMSRLISDPSASSRGGDGGQFSSPIARSLSSYPYIVLRKF